MARHTLPRRPVLAGLLTLALAGVIVSPAAAQKRPHDLLMKEVGSTFDSLRKDLDGGKSLRLYMLRDEAAEIG